MSVAQQLDELRTADLIRDLDEVECAYSFKHALVQDTAYASLLKQERRALHRVIANEIAALYPQQLGENAARLAEHYEMAEEWRKAADFSQQAGTNALRVHALREAMSHFDRAQQALGRLKDASPALVMDAVMGWAQAAARFRPYAEQIERLGYAETLARETGDTARLAQILYRAGSVHMASGHNLRAAPLFAECFTLAHELGDEQLTIVPTYFMGLVLMDSDPRGALELFDRAIALAVKYHNADVQATALGMKAMTHARLGDASESLQEVQASLELLGQLQSPMTESDVLLYAAWSHLDNGDVAQGLEFGQRGVDTALASDNMDCVCYGFACVGFANLQAQNMPRAADMFREAIRRSQFSGATQVEYLAQAGLAMAKIFGGDASAVTELEDAFVLVQANGNEFGSALVALTLGELFVQQGSTQRAEGYLDSAFAYFDGTSMHPYRERAARAFDRLAHSVT